MIDEDHVQRAAEALKEADALVITAGAGIGVDSGLPDFRGNEGFWREYPPIARLGISFVQMANPGWFEQKPALAWAFYGHRLHLYRATEPHEGFRQLLKLGREKPGSYFVYTSNVDGQFQKAGFDEERIEECHGSIHHFQCTLPCSEKIWDASAIDVDIDDVKFEAREPLPVCPYCNRIARPNVLMFGDWLWISDRTDNQSRRLQQWLDERRENNHKLAIIEVGAGEAVPTVRRTSEQIAAMYGGMLIRVNPRDVSVPEGHCSIASGGAEGIQRLYRLIYT